ncbi:MAG: DUF1501 domain-containing protein [Verrucomicrobiales bacterium]|jgi:hypothetical protein|nr:DUF1501 domain-containing protein [Verrucomicrobiales bacterium]MBT6449601.1 DUF1501 domain-containing protein [Verrucomicrobiales bacterium]MDE2714040.1 DUF1501 domain-containing protein [Verrucomicrobiota bacterium]
MNPLYENGLLQTRRELIFNSAKCLGGAALGSLMAPNLIAAPRTENGIGGLAGIPHFAPKAKRVIMLFFSGGPSHIDMFDYKPRMRDFHGTELPDSIRNGQRITGMTSGQKSFPCVAPMFKFKRHGAHGTWVSELLPNIAGIADDVTLIKSMHTEAINHDPAITYILTGTQQLGKPSFGSWISYGLGSENKDLPAYLVMISKGRGQSQALYSRLWSSGFLPSRHQGVNLRSGREPVLFLKDPEGIDRAGRRRMLDGIAKINQEQFSEFGDPETQTRISAYEMAFRMQASVPELMDVSKEPKAVKEMYGKDTAKPGTFASNCILARRMAERGVPFIHLFHRGWDQHGALPVKLRQQCEDVDQPVAALIKDLKQRGMLDETLVIVGGEFGRTIYSQGALSKTNHGRDHHGRCFTTLVAGGGFKAGYEHGATDDYSYNITRDPVHINDLNATLLQQMGIDHERLTYRFLGLDQRLTGVEGAKLIPQLVG